ncbi:MAG TPA: phosphatase PAP2 family protein [Gaiellaceae bacterium]|nr:phosphatase PAP2 family protein [Gaiellaceae bacterium]
MSGTGDSRRRASAGREIAIGLGCYASYLLVRQAVLAGKGRERARRNAERVLAAERRLHLDVEPRLQAHALTARRLLYALTVAYAAFNVSLSVGWLHRLYHRGDDGFRRERRAAALTFGAALPVFLLYPVAPPRTLDGFVDTIRESGLDLEHPFLVRFYNPVAAMPSLHAAFAVVTGVGLARRRTGLPRVGWAAYPPIVGLVVVVTGNHFVLDVVAGAALGALARRVTR